MSTKNTEVAVKEENAALALAPEIGFMDLADFDDNTGFEGADKESFAIPFLQLLQKMSPLVDEDNAKYIPGAKAGMLYNSVTGKLYDGKAGVVIIPCAYKRSFILWGGREGDGGYQGELTVDEFESYKADSSKAVQVEGQWYVPNADGTVNPKKNTYFADTRSHFCILIDATTGEYGSAILSLASSQIKSSKKLMTSLQQKKVATPNGLMTPPTFANLVRVTTVGQSNDKGSWSGVQFELEGLVTNKDLYAAAKDFYKAVVGGEMKADYSKADATSAQGDVSEKPVDAEGF